MVIWLCSKELNLKRKQQNAIAKVWIKSVVKLIKTGADSSILTILFLVKEGLVKQQLDNVGRCLSEPLPPPH